MFEVGWTEMLVIAIVMIVVIGPKDLPQMLRQFGRTTAKLRGMAGDFRRQFDEALKEADLEDVKKSVDTLRGLNPATEIRKQLNPFQQAAQDVRSGLESAMKPKPPIAAEPASPVAQAVEPLKTGPTEMPGESLPAAQPISEIPAQPLAPVSVLPEPVAAASTTLPDAAPMAASPTAERPAAVKRPRAPRKATANGQDGEPMAAPRAPRKRAPAKSAETPS